MPTITYYPYVTAEGGALSGFDVGAGVDLIEVVQALAKEKLTT